MLFSVLKNILIVLGVILVGVAIWLFVGISRVINTEHEVIARFHDVVQYYVSMDQEYVMPLLSASGGLVGGDLEKLQIIDRQMRDLGTTVNADDQYEKLLMLQRTIIPFLGSVAFPENFQSSALYQEWSKNCTNLGKASALIKEYNEVLSLYNAQITSHAGRLAGFWKRWSHRQYLSIDGSLQEETRVTF